jgi:UDP-N-acetylmuramoylalanine--D-glutamate ligase
MQEYIDAKKAVFTSMKKGGRLVTNALCDVTMQFASFAKENGFETLTFRSDGNDGDVCIKNGAVYLEGEKVLDVSEIVLPGKHNVENYMAALSAVYPYVTKDAVRRVATTFGGVEHRLELVRTHEGVKYYNSSIDSTPARTKAALSCFGEEMNGKIVLILGGKDKNLDFTELGDVICKKVKHVFISHDTPENKMYNCVVNSALYDSKKTGVTVCCGFDDAVKQASSFASIGDVVVLSPAATSFDEFSNFEERGRRFKTLVNSL